MGLKDIKTKLGGDLTPGKVTNLLLGLCAYFLYNIHMEFKEMRSHINRSKLRNEVQDIRIDQIDKRLKKLENESNQQNHNSRNRNTTGYFSREYIKLLEG